MTLSLQDVEHIAMLARLALSDEEKALFAAQLASILEYAQKLQTLHFDTVLPADSRSIASTPLRDDEPEPALDPEVLLQNAPLVTDRQFRIPPVFD